MHAFGYLLKIIIKIIIIKESAVFGILILLSIQIYLHVRMRLV